MVAHLPVMRSESCHSVRFPDLRPVTKPLQPLLGLVAGDCFGRNSDGRRVRRQLLFIAVCGGEDYRRNSPFLLRNSHSPDVAGTAGVCRPATPSQHRM